MTSSAPTSGSVSPTVSIYVAANFGIEGGEDELIAALNDLDETHG